MSVPAALSLPTTYPPLHELCKIHDLPPHRPAKTPKEANARHVDATIIVVNDNEWHVALQLISFDCTVALISLKQTAYLGSFRCISAQHRVVVIKLTSAGSAGPGGSHAVLTASFEYFTPRLAATVGCAFGNDVSLHALLDVLVSLIIAPYEKTRVSAQLEENRNPVYPVSPDVASWIAAAKHEWRFAKTTRGLGLGNTPVDVHEGAMLCGEKVIDSVEFKAKTIEVVGDQGGRVGGQPIIGGEMEGAGIYSACSVLRSLPCIIIKGVSDHGADKAGKSAEDMRAVLVALSPGIDFQQLQQQLGMSTEEVALKHLFKRVLQRMAIYSSFAFLQHCLYIGLMRGTLPEHWKPVSITRPKAPSEPVPLAVDHPLHPSALSLARAWLAEQRAKAKVKTSDEDLFKRCRAMKKQYGELKEKVEAEEKAAQREQKVAIAELESLPWTLPTTTAAVDVDNQVVHVSRTEHLGKVKWSADEIEKLVGPVKCNEILNMLRAEAKVEIGCSLPKTSKRKRSTAPRGKQKQSKSNPAASEDDHADDDSDDEEERKEGEDE